MTSPFESLIESRGKVLRLREISVKLDGILLFDDVIITITLEDKSSILNRDDRVTVEFGAKRRKSCPALPERFRNFYIDNSAKVMLRIQSKITKREGIHTRSEYWSPSFEINGMVLHSKCASFKKNGDLIEFVPTIPVTQKYNVTVELRFHLGHPDASDLSDCVKLLEEKMEKKESLMDKLGCVGKIINTILIYGRPLSEMNSFAKVAFATADRLFTSIKTQDDCKDEACTVIRRVRDTLEDAQKLYNDSDTFGYIINRILILAEEIIQVVRDYDGGFATELRRAAISPTEMLDRLKGLNQRLDETRKRLDSVISVHVVENTREIHDEVVEIRQKQEDHNRRGDLEKICKWLSDMNFAAFPAKVHGASHKGSGGWFLESQEFVEWKTGRSRLLWCSGIPGSGKTTMSAIVLKHLCSVPDLLTDNCLLNIYCRHDMKSKQTVSNFLRCLWAQLASQRDFVSKTLTACYDRFVKYRMDPSSHELIESLRGEFQSFPIVYLVVDGLDECGDDAVLEEFATTLKELGQAQNTRIFMTSRPYPNIRGILVPEFRSHTLVADRGDMERFIKSQFEYPKSFGRVVDSSTIISREMIADAVIHKAGGMFLLVRLHMGSLQGLGSAQEIKDRLDHLANLDVSDDERATEVLNNAYNDTMKRIEGHPLHEHALKLLQWIVYAQEPQTIGALRYAISTIKPTDTALNDNDLADEDGLISACAGLINFNRMHEEEESTVRLVHETTEVYLRRLFGSLSSCHASIMKKCLQALSLPLYYLKELGLLHKYETWTTVTSQLRFLKYASTFWSMHARNADEASEDHAMDFLARLANQKAFKLLSLLAGFYSMHTPWYSMDTTSLDFEHRSPSPVHLAAFFGLHRALRTRQLKGTPLNTIMDRARSSPLIYAIMGGGIKSLNIFLGYPSVDLNWRNIHGKQPLALAVEYGNERMVKLLLDQERINCDCRDLNWYSIADDHVYFNMVQLLYERDDADLGFVLQDFCRRPPNKEENLLYR